MGDVAKGTNEGSLDNALRGLADLLIGTVSTMYQMGYLNDLTLENQARDLQKMWMPDETVDNPNDPQGAMEQ